VAGPGAKSGRPDHRYEVFAAGALDLKTIRGGTSIVTLTRQDRDSTHWEEAPMSSLDFELDSRIDEMEFEWRQAHEAQVIARAEYLALAANPEANASAIDLARERLRRAEGTEARIFAKIEQLEDSMLGLG
jgi:hypothetical protein